MIYFFDTSALVKLYHREVDTDKVLDIYSGKEDIIISELAKIELYSSVYRRCREQEIEKEILDLVIKKFEYDAKNRFQIVHFTSGLTEQAEKIFKDYGEFRGLKTLDSLQFAFFRFYCDADDTTFACWDTKFRNILKEENIKVLPA